MNTSIHLQYTSECQAENLTNAVQKYIKESIFRISLADFEIMFLSNTFGSRAAGALMLGAASLASFGSAATAQDQIARAPAGQPVATQYVGKPVLLRIGPGVHPDDVKDLKRSIAEAGCFVTDTTVRGLPKRMTVEVGDKKFAFADVGSAGNKAKDWCLDRS